MDGILGILGILAASIGSVVCFSGLYDGNSAQIMLGLALLLSGLGYLAVSSIIKLLKEIRDSIRAKG